MSAPTISGNPAARAELKAAEALEETFSKFAFQTTTVPGDERKSHRIAGFKVQTSKDETEAVFVLTLEGGATVRGQLDVAKATWAVSSQNVPIRGKPSDEADWQVASWSGYGSFTAPSEGAVFSGRGGGSRVHVEVHFAIE